MPNFLPNFYYTSPQSREQTTVVNTGNPNITHFINGREDRWNKKGAGIEKKPKKLYINDAMVENWGDDKLKRFKERALQAMKEGFTLHLIAYGKPVSLNQTEIGNLDRKTLINKVRPIRPFTKEQISNLTHDPIDQIYLLDDYGMNEFIHNKADNQRIIDTHTLAHMPWYKRDDFIEYLRHSQPPVSEILHNEETKTAESLFSALKLQFPVASTRTKIKYCNNPQYRLKPECHFYTFITTEKLKDLCSGMELSNAGYLKMALSGDSDITLLESGNFTSVEEISLEVWEINNQNLAKIFKACPNLKKLNLKTNRIQKTQRTTQGKLEQIELLDFSASQLQSLIVFIEYSSCMELRVNEGLEILYSDSLVAHHLFNKNDEEYTGLYEIQSLPSDAAAILTKDAYVNLRGLYFRNPFYSQDQDTSLLTNNFQRFSSFKQLQKLACNPGNLVALYNKFNHELKSNQPVPQLFPGLTEIKSTVLFCLLPILARFLTHHRLKRIDHLSFDTRKGPEKNYQTPTLDFDCYKSLEEISIYHISKAKQPIECILQLPNLKVIDLSHLKGEESIKLIETLRSMHKYELILPKNFKSQTHDENKNTQTVINEHRPEQYEHKKPTPSDFDFQYQLNKNSKSQQLYINQLLQYLKLKQKHLHYLPSLNDGICITLARLFIEQSLKEWDRMTKQLQQWDGRIETLTHELETLLEALFEQHKKYQHEKSGQQTSYVGSEMASFLSQNKETLKQGTIVKNPWHAIAIRYMGDEKWQIYEPNWDSGYLEYQTPNVAKAIEKTLGSITNVEYRDKPHIPEIQNFNAINFIEKGGLISLDEFQNSEKILRLIYQSPLVIQSTEAHNGLFLRDNKGRPAWIIGLNSPITRALTIQLLQEWIKQNPDNGLQRLAASTSELTPMQKQEYLTQLIQAMGSEKAELAESNPNRNNPIEKNLSDKIESIPARFVEEIKKVFHEVSHKTYFQEKLATWVKHKSITGSLTEYSQHLANGEANGKKRLVELNSEQSLTALKLNLAEYCQRTKRPLFIANSPEDLACGGPCIEKKGQTGQLKKGHGGAFYAFLMANKNTVPAPVVIVNFSQFRADEIVQFNSMLDKKRTIDGVDIPENMVICGLMNTSDPECYRGSDFYSRFNVAEHCPVTDTDLEHSLKPLSVSEKPKAESESINLYHGSDWKDQLLGRWVLHGKQLVFEEGELTRVLKNRKGNTPVTLVNGPWDEPRFVEFWHQVQTLGEVLHAGERIEIPKDLQLIKSEGYAFDKLAEQLIKTDSPATALLNPFTLNSFFAQYQCQSEEKSITLQPGLLEHHQNKQLALTLTRALSEDEWGRLLNEAKKHKVKLICHASEAIKVPQALKSHIQFHSKPAFDCSKNTQVIESAFPGATLQKQALKFDKVIPINEVATSDLMGGLDGDFNKETLEFCFSERASLLQQWLNEGQHVVLHGDFSPQWVDALAPLLKARGESQSKNQGQLMLVGTEMSAFSYTTIYKATGVAQKPQYSEKPLQLLSEQSFTFNPDTCEHDSKAFKQNRLEAVSEALSKNPYALLTGLTGVGKSTFVEKELKAQNHNVYLGTEALSEWASDSSEAPKILFIDEANLTHRNWTEFEGLYNTPPSLFYQGKYYPLTDKHKVLFACNPSTYDVERNRPAFFSAHDSEVEFTPIPPAMIYEDMLKDLLSKEQAKPLLEVYAFLCKHSTSEVLISPREVQMMALLTLSEAQNHPEIEIKKIAAQKASQLGSKLVLQAHQEAFNKKFKTAEKLSTDILQKGEFFITPSRRPVYAQLNELLQLREFRRKATNDASKYGGLGGLIIEGMPGVGKSELVMQTLIDKGYQEVHAHRKKQPQTDKRFYRMPASLSLEEKKELLLKAFDEGAIVIADEINSSPMLERFLNDLLMGTYKGKRPQNPGFMLIGTQNPASMAGRRQASNALKRRLISMELPPYPLNEIKQILTLLGMAQTHANDMADVFETQCKKAMAQNLTPAPAFRDLFELAQEFIAPQNKQEIKPQPTDESAEDEPLSESPRHSVLDALILKLEKIVESHSESQEALAASQLLQSLKEIDSQMTEPKEKTKASLDAIYKYQTQIETASGLLNQSKSTVYNLLKDMGIVNQAFIRENRAKEPGFFQVKASKFDIQQEKEMLLQELLGNKKP